MNQSTAVEKVIKAMLFRGLIRKLDIDMITPLMDQVYAIGYDKGRMSHIQLRAVVQYSLNGRELEVFESIKVASNKTGTFTRDIAKVASGKRKTANGYKWQFLDSVTLLTKHIQHEKASR